jgi:hypothetical protein
MKTVFKTPEHIKFDDTITVYRNGSEKIMNMWTIMFFSSSASINQSHVIS